MVDVLLGTIPIPLIDLLRRFRAIKLELRQLGHINRLEKLYVSTQAKEAESKPPNESSQVQQPE
ncbi:MAG: hypothetical protein QXT25_00850 [Candidatus Anstonellaceae archaeon]